MKTRTVLTPDDWADAALLAAAEGGFGCISVEGLARRLEVSKGSFYWHFTGLEALLKAACARWEAAGTDETIVALESIDDPKRRLEALFEVSVERLEHLKVEGAIAAAAARGDRHARPVYARVTRRRLEYVETLYSKLGYAPGPARAWARLAFGAYLGTVQLATIGLVANHELGAHGRFLKGTLLPPAGPRRRSTRRTG